MIDIAASRLSNMIADVVIVEGPELYRHAPFHELLVGMNASTTQERQQRLTALPNLQQASGKKVPEPTDGISALHFRAAPPQAKPTNTMCRYYFFCSGLPRPLILHQSSLLLTLPPEKNAQLLPDSTIEMRELRTLHETALQKSADVAEARHRAITYWLSGEWSWHQRGMLVPDALLASAWEYLRDGTWMHPDPDLNHLHKLWEKVTEPPPHPQRSAR